MIGVGEGGMLVTDKPTWEQLTEDEPACSCHASWPDGTIRCVALIMYT